MQHSLTSNQPSLCVIRAPEFFDVATFGPPKDLGEISGRLNGNVSYFQANYSIVVALVLAYVCYHDKAVFFALTCLAGAGFWLFNVRKNQLAVSGRVFTEQEILIGYAVISATVLSYVGGSFLTYSLAFAGLIILIHAAAKKVGMGQSATNVVNEKLN